MKYCDNSAYNSLFETYFWCWMVECQTSINRCWNDCDGLLGIGQLVSPVISGIVMSHYGVSHVIAIDICTCMFAILSLLVVSFPSTSSYQKELSGNFHWNFYSLTTSVDSKGKLPFSQEVMIGWNYIRERPGFVALLLTISFCNLIDSYIISLLPPVEISLNFHWSLITTLVFSLCLDLSLWRCWDTSARLQE